MYVALYGMSSFQDIGIFIKHLLKQ